MSETVGHNSVVAIHYTLTNDAGAVLDSSRERDPMPYLHGHNNIVVGLEKALEGKSVGDKLVVDVSPADGYGERTGPGPQAVPRREFPKDVQLEVGMSFMSEGSDGERVALHITDIRGSRVFVDINHPLAGENLHFDVEITMVRPANESEQKHGHPHGLDGTSGHHH